MKGFTEEIVRALSASTGVAAAQIRLEQPRDLALADLALPCFVIAKQLGKPPPAVAAELATKLAGQVAGVTATAAGPYVNFKIERAALSRELFADIGTRRELYGNSVEGAGKTIVIDFSSPNIAKPMHVGHIRSTIIGAALVRIFRALGYRVVGINHIGDWGAQFGGLVVALRRANKRLQEAKLASDIKDFESISIVELKVLARAMEDAIRDAPYVAAGNRLDPVLTMLKLYQASKKASETDPEFRREAVEAYQELESGREGEVRKLWRAITKLSRRGFDATYERLKIRHDLVRGESEYEDRLAPTLERVKQAGVTEVSRGALIVDLKSVDKGLAETPCLLQQTNGTTLYATRDLAALFQRWDEFHFERCLYVVGAEQKLHFRQLKAVLKRMQLDWEPRVEHVDFGLLLGPGRVKLASRKGEVLVLDDLIDEVVDEARAIVREKNPELANADAIAEQVGIGALVFNDLKRERIKDVVFNKAEIVSFEGETGPYLQYTHARLASIVRKSSGDPATTAVPDFAQLEDAGAILVRLARFPDVVHAAAAKAEPSEISNYLLALARELNSWYVEHRVLGVEPGLGAARLALVRASKFVLANGLSLLGIAAPQEM